MEKSYKILIDNLKLELINRGWTQEELGAQVGLSQERISNLLNGKTHPTLYLLDSLADCLDLDSAELITEKDISAPTEESTPSLKKRNTGAFTKYGKNSKVKNTTLRIPNLESFRVKYREFLFNPSIPKSGKSNSYVNYIEYLIQNYFDIYNEVLDPLDEITISKLNQLRLHPDFSDFNFSEKRFPNASINMYCEFMLENN